MIPWSDVDHPDKFVSTASQLLEKHDDRPDIKESYVKAISLLEEVQRLDGQLENAERKRTRAEDRLAAAEVRLTRLQLGQVVSEGSAEATEGAEPPPPLVGGPLFNPRVQDLLNELTFFRQFLFGWTYFFTTMPAELLTLILTLSMGALGSVIYLTREFFGSGTNHPLSWYFFRPFLGMITALAIFVLAKAGVLIIADTSQASDFSGDLNPFFISFLAIVSGLLSEQATQRIQAAGVQFFTSETDAELDAAKPRWAMKLKDEMTQQGRSIAEMRNFVDADEAEMQQWMEQLKPVPGPMQTIIAAWLNKPKRELFSDLPPA